MRRRGCVPGELLASALGPGTRLAKSGRIVEQLLQGTGQSVHVPGRHYPSRAERPHDLAETAHVVDDTWHARAERL